MMAGLIGLCGAGPVRAQEQSNCAGPGCPATDEVPPGVNDPAEYLREKAQCAALQTEIIRRASLPPEELQELPELSHAAIETCRRKFETHRLLPLPSFNPNSLGRAIPIPTPPSDESAAAPNPTASQSASPPDGAAESPLRIYS